MRKIFSLLLLLTPLCLQAQRLVEESFSLPAGQPLRLELKHGSDIQLKGWDKPQVLVKASVQVNGGKHNDAFRLNSSSAGKGLTVTSVLDESKITSGGAAGDCKGSTWQFDSENGANNICLEITYEVWLPKNTNLQLNTISGNVTAKNLQGPLDLNSISGFIDVSWPAEQQADLWLTSVTGELYTNLEVKVLNPQEKIPMVGYELKGQLGKGGQPLRLQTISSNIYLRKE